MNRPDISLSGYFAFWKLERPEHLVVFPIVGPPVKRRCERAALNVDPKQYFGKLFDIENVRPQSLLPRRREILRRHPVANYAPAIWAGPRRVYRVQQLEKFSKSFGPALMERHKGDVLH